jgi:protein involved in polysaccharide export with SLBB domain
MPSFLRFASIAIALLAVSVAGRAQSLPSRPGPFSGIPATGQPGPGFVQPGMGMAQERMSVVDPDKKLSAGDQVTVEIVEDRDGGFPRMVTATGELDVPPLGRVRVSGKTAAEAAAEIKELLERDYYYHATVRLAIDRVSPVGVRAGAVYLSGEVRAGGPMEIISGETLTFTNAILRAGGITEWGDANKIQITRLQKDGTPQKMTVSFKKITQSGDARQDPVLQDGDRIFVPRIFVRFN